MYEIGIIVVVLLVLFGLLGAAAGDTLAQRLRRALGADDRIEAAVEEESRQRSADALAILGATLVGLGVILFFAANWGEIPRWLRLAMLLAAIAATYAGAFREWDRRPRAAQVLAFVGVLLFGASIFLVGQMYNVQAHDPLAFLLWSLAAAAVGVVVASPALAGLATITLFAWFIFELLRVQSIEYDVETYLPVLFLLLGCTLYANATWAQPWLDRVRFSGPIRLLGFGSRSRSARLS